MKSFIGLLLSCMVILLHGQTESIFWKIEGKGLSQPSYLFGTYHMINHGFLEKEAPKVHEAYLNADQVIVESVMIDSVDQLVLQKHIYSDLPVHELLSEEEYRLADSIFKLRIDQPLIDYDEFKPMLIGLFLGLEYHSMYLNDHGNYEGEPIDMYFQHSAQERNIVLKGLESTEESYSYLLDSVQLDDQIQILLDIAENDDKIYDVAGDMYENYRINKLKKVIKSVDYYHSFVSDAGMDLLTDGRNFLWMERLPEMLITENSFIAVGCLHLVDKNGLISLLRKEGYKLTPLPLK